MAYEWRKGLCNKDGIPFAKLANSYLEKTDASGKVIASDTFMTQAAVDQAWADGFHVPNKPETRDVGPPEPEITSPEPGEPEDILETAGAEELIIEEDSPYGGEVIITASTEDKKKSGRPKKR
jgi:hypothetical protein